MKRFQTLFVQKNVKLTIIRDKSVTLQEIGGGNSYSVTIPEISYGINSICENDQFVYVFSSLNVHALFEGSCYQYLKPSLQTKTDIRYYCNKGNSILSKSESGHWICSDLKSGDVIWETDKWIESVDHKTNTAKTNNGFLDLTTGEITDREDEESSLDCLTIGNEHVIGLSNYQMPDFISQDKIEYAYFDGKTIILFKRSSVELVDLSSRRRKASVALENLPTPILGKLEDGNYLFSVYGGGLYKIDLKRARMTRFNIDNSGENSELYNGRYLHTANRVIDLRNNRVLATVASYYYEMVYADDNVIILDQHDPGNKQEILIPVLDKKQLLDCIGQKVGPRTIEQNELKVYKNNGLFFE